MNRREAITLIGGAAGRMAARGAGTADKGISDWRVAPWQCGRRCIPNDDA
jgi:hypothetical protein